MKLYWVSTKQGLEDWFIVANSEEEARESHEDFEGFARGSAKAKFVCDIPNNLKIKYNITEAKWPSHALIRELGGKITAENNPRKVNFNGMIFIEGSVTESIFLDEIGRKAGVYIIKIQNTEKYKIGKTIDLKRRLKQLATGNPYNIKITYFIQSKHYKSLEKHLHKVFKDSRISGEWFQWNKEKLDELEAHLKRLSLEESGAFKVYNLKDVSISSGVY